MRAIRDLLSIIGSIGVGWCLFAWNHHTERGLATGLVVGLVCLICCIVAIRCSGSSVSALRRKLDKVEIRNSYLETAIKQLGTREQR